MSESYGYRHHRAGRDGPVVVLVPVPVGGSNEPIRHVKPGPYPNQRREAWRPATRPPSKAAASVRLMDAFARQDRIIAEFMRPHQQRPRP
jgi:hypothetical protein